VSRSNQFCRHNHLCYFSASVYCCSFRHDLVRKLSDTPSYLISTTCYEVTVIQVIVVIPTDVFGEVNLPLCLAMYHIAVPIA
jgi:hypothetical protein